MEIYKPILLQGISICVLLMFYIFSFLKKSYVLKTVALGVLLVLILAVFINRNYGANIDLPLYMDFYKYNVTFTDIFISKTAWKGDFLFFGLMPISHIMGLGENGYITFQLSISITLTFIAYFLFFKDSKSLVFLALFFMLNSSSFYLIQGNVIRQGLSSSLLLLGICASTKFKTNLFKVLAFFSHKGSLFSFLSTFIDYRNKIRILILMFAFFIGYFSVFVHIINLFPIPEFIAIKLEFYSSFERASSNSLIKLMLLVCFNISLLFFRNTDLVYEKAYSFFFIFSVAALLLFRFDGMFSRLVLYTDIFIPILSVGCIQQFTHKKNRVLVALAMIVLSLIYSIYVFNHESIIFNMGEYYRI